jgi:hypothetical protein
MKSQNYVNELAEWQEKIDRVVNRFDVSCADKAKVLPQITDLHILRAEMKDRVEELRMQDSNAENSNVYYFVPSTCGCCC